MRRSGGNGGPRFRGLLRVSGRIRFAEKGRPSEYAFDKAARRDRGAPDPEVADGAPPGIQAGSSWLIMGGGSLLLLRGYRLH